MTGQILKGVGIYKNGTNSYFYKHLIDENKGTYILVQSIAHSYSSIVSSIEYYGNHIQTGSEKDGSFAEYNYNIEGHVYHVMKI